MPCRSAFLHRPPAARSIWSLRTGPEQGPVASGNCLGLFAFWGVPSNCSSWLLASFIGPGHQAFCLPLLARAW